MKPYPPTEKRWSAFAWVSSILLLVGFQYAVMALISPAPRPGNTPPTKPPSPPVLALLGRASASSMHPSSSLLAMEDPSLFALPHREGLAGALWQRDLSSSNSLARWDPPADWLPLRETGLGIEFKRLANAPQARWSGLDLREPPPHVHWKDIPEPKLQPPPPSMQLMGDLGRRTLLKSPAIPTLESDEILRDTVLILMVGDSGVPLVTAPVLQSSGSAHADSLALELARTLRFQPTTTPQNFSAAGASRLTAGRVIFHWCGGTTNAPPNP